MIYKLNLMIAVHCLLFFFLIQEILIALGVRGATLQHKMAPPCSGWYDQVGLSDYFHALLPSKNVAFAVSLTVVCATDC